VTTEVKKTSPLLTAIFGQLEADIKLSEERVSKPGRFTPSSIVGCTRAAYYRFIGEKKQTTDKPQGFLRKKHGEAIHTLVQDLFQRKWGANFQREVEVKATTPHPILGFCDGVVTLKSGEKFVVEIKSAAQKYYKQYKKAPDFGHAAQAIIYATLLKIPFSHVVYYNKNDELEEGADPPIPIKEFHVPTDATVWQMMVGKMDTVTRAALAKEPPPQEVTFKCRSCSYFHVCQPRL
jgi:CRISPR/Cas system-associated exonuclease Cas4 (RecB family)